MNVCHLFGKPSTSRERIKKLLQTRLYVTISMLGQCLTFFQAVESITEFFQENPDAQAFFANINDAEGNAKVCRFDQEYCGV